MANTPQTLYFHGLPGSPDELQLFGPEAANAASTFHVVDRRLLPTEKGQGTPPFAALAARIRHQFGNSPLHFVGFSLGACAALRTAACLGEQVMTLHLVSAAAPLSLGDYLSDMAGGQIFRLAQISPLLFAGFVRLQSLSMRISTEMLSIRLFQTARGDDCAFAADPTFKLAMLRLLRESLGPGLDTYRDEISHYVADWAPDLAAVTQPVTLHHGSADNWTPIAMAHDLARHLPNVVDVREYEGASHYSTLRAYLGAV
jgi:pimeloyl-ACP methyl ester carboxylesterase